MTTTGSTLLWTSWPARERPGAAVVALLAVVTFGFAGALCGGHWLVGVASSLLLLGFLHRFWFPVRCAVDGERAEVRTLFGARSIPLATVRRIANDERAVLLSSRSVASASDGVRGLVMPLPARNGAAIVDGLRARLGPTERR